MFFNVNVFKYTFILYLPCIVQDVLSTFNLRQCTVPNYALRYVLQCACNDTAYRIPDPQRSQSWSDGALWCVGTLSMLLVDGTTSIVYNPYPLDVLSTGVSGITAYIDCLSVNSDPTACNAPPAESTQLPILVQQGVDPIAVWGRCKSNYALSMWDVGTGALFTAGISGTSASIGNHNNNIPQDVATAAIAWASEVSPDFLSCLQQPSLLQLDYSSCMRLFFSQRANQTPNAYFVYEPATSFTEPPDACLVFSGLQAAALPGSTLQTLMTNCLMQEGIGEPAACDLNPLVMCVCVQC